MYVCVYGAAVSCGTTNLVMLARLLSRCVCVSVGWLTLSLYGLGYPGLCVYMRACVRSAVYSFSIPVSLSVCTCVCLHHIIIDDGGQRTNSRLEGERERQQRKKTFIPLHFAGRQTASSSLGLTFLYFRTPRLRLVWGNVRQDALLIGEMLPVKVMLVDLGDI